MRFARHRTPRARQPKAALAARIGDLPVVRAGDSPVVAVAANGHHVRGNSPLVAPAARANFLRKNVAIAARASDLPA
jgi:hypothetical protein